MVKSLRWVALLLLGALCFAVVTQIAGAIPFPPAQRLEDGERGSDRVTIYVFSNGFHSDIVVPRALADTYLPIRSEDFPVDADAIEYYAIGWGSRTAFTSLLAVSDLTPSIVVRALAFDETVLRVTPLGQITMREHVYTLDTTSAQAAFLVQDLQDWFAASGPIEGATQGLGDRFYPARGRFTPWHTCNSWTGRRLRNASVSVGLWTPSAQALEFGLRSAGQDQDQKL